MKSTAN